jgi:hypothetical protein
MVYRNGVKVGWHLIKPCPLVFAKIVPDRVLKNIIKDPNKLAHLGKKFNP